LKATVLLIDDSKFLRKANELALVRFGYAVLTASDGDEGLAIAMARIPDLIVLDLMLPKLSGAQLLQALKESPHTAQIPVVVLSSLPISNAAKLQTAGAAAYFEKAKLGIENGSTALIQAIDKLLSSPRSPQKT
jgi:putative two-component system response regulator